MNSDLWNHALEGFHDLRTFCFLIVREDAGDEYDGCEYDAQVELQNKFAIKYQITEIPKIIWIHACKTLISKLDMVFLQVENTVTMNIAIFSLSLSFL